MKNNWKKSLLGDVTTMQYGYTASADTEEVGPKFLRITDIVPDQIDWNEVPYCKISDKYYQKYKLKKGDVVVARTGATAGYAKLIREDVDAVFASYLIRVTPNTEEVDSGYLGIIIESESFKRFVESTKSGSAQPQANAPILRNFELLHPDLNTQKTIFDILNNFNQLIRINNRRIQILEEIAQRLYEEWFIHFKFPGHEKVKLIDSELGKIPEGWNVSKINSITEIITRGYQPKYKKDSPCRVINQRCIRNHKIDVNLTRGNDINKRPISNTDRYVKVGDILINSTGVGTLGRLAQVNEKLENYIVDSHVTIVRPKNTINMDYFGCCLISIESLIENMGKGATGQTELSKEAIENIDILIPPMKAQEEFSKNVQPIKRMIINLLKKNIVLIKTRDLLLPRLISGDIEV